MSIFTRARRDGTSVQGTDATYGHLADDGPRGPDLLDAYDAATGHVAGTDFDSEAARGEAAS